jgi:hypothetical protein
VLLELRRASFDLKQRSMRAFATLAEPFGLFADRRIRDN